MVTKDWAMFWLCMLVLGGVVWLVAAVVGG
jgi:hypothetical protein